MAPYYQNKGQHHTFKTIGQVKICIDDMICKFDLCEQDNFHLHWFWLPYQNQLFFHRLKFLEFPHLEIVKIISIFTGKNSPILRLWRIPWFQPHISGPAPLCCTCPPPHASFKRLSSEILNIEFECSTLNWNLLLSASTCIFEKTFLWNGNLRAGHHLEYSV